MSPFSFATATEIRFGRGLATKSVADIAALGRRALVVTGANPNRSHWLGEALAANGATVVTFAMPVEPTIDLIESGVAVAAASSADFVVAIGGGSAIDAGKAIAALVPSTRRILDHLEVVGHGLPLDSPPLPFVAVPTTAGTGAEVTRNAVVGVPEFRRKVSLRDKAMLPRMAIIDPSLTDGTPRNVTLASGLDAITQVIEPYISARANPLTDALCRSAIPLGLSALKSLMEAEVVEARDQLAWVSLCGGMALANSGLGVVHGLAGPLGGLTGAAHGAICGALLPHGLALNEAKSASPSTAKRIAELREWIAHALECRPDEAFDRLSGWSRTCGLAGLDVLGVSPDAREDAAKAAAGSSSMKANPAELTQTDLIQMMERAR